MIWICVNQSANGKALLLHCLVYNLLYFILPLCILLYYVIFTKLKGWLKECNYLSSVLLATIFAKCDGSSSRRAIRRVLRLWSSLSLPLCVLYLSHLWSCCYYAIVSPLLSSGPTMNHSQWQTLKNMCYIIWFGEQGLSPYRLEPVTRPLLTQQRLEALVWVRAFPCHLCLLLLGGRAKNGHGMWNLAGDMEHWSACHSASRHCQGQWRKEDAALRYGVPCPIPAQQAEVLQYVYIECMCIAQSAFSANTESTLTFM